MADVTRYTFRVRYAAQSAKYVATVAEVPGVSCAAGSALTAFEGLVTELEALVEQMTSRGESPPVPLGEREYSGKFLLRLPPEAHRQLAMEAAEQGVSLNQLVNTRLLGSR
jgi:predicted HicB family RNase H-like nuclease